MSASVFPMASQRSITAPSPGESPPRPTKNSPTIVPMTASPEATRSPVTISGTAEGSSSFHKVAVRLGEEVLDPQQQREFDVVRGRADMAE